VAALAAGGRGHSASGSRDELAALHETALVLIDQVEPDAVLRAIVERAGRLVGTEHGYLCLPEPDGKTLTVRVATGLLEQNLGCRIAAGEGLAGRVWGSGEPLVVSDYAAWPGRSRAFDGQPLHALVGVPLRSGGRVEGVLGLVHVQRGRRFCADEVALLERFGRLASLALERASLYAAARAEVLERRRAEEELLDVVARLRRSESEVERAHREMIRRLAHAAEFRSAETSLHVDRMSRYCLLLAERLGLEPERCELIRAASALHDVGKIAIPDRILLKPGPLTAAERRDMERHAGIGHALLSGSSSELLEVAAVIALTHHERYDGRGYPRGLAGTEIPLEGRIASIADVYDALTSARVYRAALPAEQAIALLRAGRGTQFDPLVLDLFLDLVHAGEGAVASGGRCRARASGLEGGARMPSCPARGGERMSAALVDAACACAAEALDETADDRQAIDRALERLREVGGELLLPSVYLVDHDRLWLVAQRGYDEVRDGFSLEQGILARALRTGQPQFVADVRADGDFIAATSSVRSELAVPFDAGVAGVVNLETKLVELPPQALAPVSRLTERIAPRVAAIGSDASFDLARLARLCVFASSLRGVGPIAEFAARILGRLLDLESAQISLAAGDGRRLASFWRLPGSDHQPLGPDELERLGGLATPGGAAFGIVEAGRVGIGDGDLGWFVRLPLQAAGTEIGALVGRAGSPPALAREQAEAATLFAQHAAALIDVAAALRREQRAAVADPLTGLLNRRGFETRLDEEIERSRRSGCPFAVVLFDCDDLKRLNDEGGHERGDAALRRVAESIRAHKRSSDLAARFGGDEFALLLSETEPEGAGDAAERICAGIRDESRRAGVPVTATYGVASFPGDAVTAGGLVHAADRRLHAAKRRSAQGLPVRLASTA